MLCAFETGLIALLIGYLLTPVIRGLAHRISFTDRPDGRRKIQKKPVALGGGLAVFLTVVITLAIANYLFDLRRLYEYTSRLDWSLWGMGWGRCCFCVVGLFDDRYGMKGKYKLLAQVLAAAFIVGSGLVVTKAQVFNISWNWVFWACWEPLSGFSAPSIR